MNSSAKNRAGVCMRFVAMRRTCGGVGFGIVGPSLWFSLLHSERRKMDRPFGKKFKKSPKYSQRGAFLGIPANIAAGPLGFRAELNIAPEGESLSFLSGSGC